MPLTACLNVFIFFSGSLVHGGVLRTEVKCFGLGGMVWTWKGSATCNVNILDRALADLDEAYENSTGFKGYTPSDDISVYGALEQMGSNDLEYTFQRALHEMYKFQVLRRETARG